MQRLLVLVPLLSAVVAGQAPVRPGRAEGKKSADVLARREGKLKVGDMAIDFNLKRPRSEEKVSLTQFRGKRPVALVFGSYT